MQKIGNITFNPNNPKTRRFTHIGEVDYLMKISHYKFNIQNASFDGSEILSWEKVLENIRIEKKEKEKKFSKIL